MREQEIARSDEDGNWEPVQDINNIGPTFEWYVTEWFRRREGVLACCGVQMEGFPQGGDLDVVAIVDSAVVMVECKGGAPRNVDDGQLDRFLQRAARLQPDIALLLFASDDKIDEKVKKLQDIYQRSTIYGLEGTEDWKLDCVYVANVEDSIAQVLETILKTPAGNYDSRPLHAFLPPRTLAAHAHLALMAD